MLAGYCNERSVAVGPSRRHEVGRAWSGSRKPILGREASSLALPSSSFLNKKCNILVQISKTSRI